MTRYRRATLRCGHFDEVPAALQKGDWWNCLTCQVKHPITALSVFESDRDVPLRLVGRRTS